ncbi:LacI family DNA-binding transcriptional regulator [Aureimonas sp. AU4]|uniref:LacI family DNA-binding transcriptional regulator n=1 Tax=Aureimonas sp. AU4 TaxID=1638163 RepID=UPI0007846579|nr:LacI family DNA-binding transcriptional regulator [Aureimonas sp. AU4]
MPKVTLATIAEATGLSKFAVSRALSGKDGVSAATRERVRRVALDMGYNQSAEPDEISVLGVVFNNAEIINSELHLRIQGGVQVEAQRRGYEVRNCWSSDRREILAFARSCRGIALVGRHERDTILAVGALGLPVARSGWVEPLDPFDVVSGTDHEAGSAVARYLLGLGHRTIAYVHGTPGYRGRVERFYGLREVLEPHSDVAFREMRFQSETRFLEHLELAHSDGFFPTAFFCAHDGMALTVMSELLRLGLRIPEDASVVGFGDYSAATQIWPPMTTVRVQGHEIGAGLVRMLDDRLRGKLPADIPFRLQVASTLVIRGSAGPAGPAGASGANLGR